MKSSVGGRLLISFRKPFIHSCISLTLASRISLSLVLSSTCHFCIQVFILYKISIGCIGKFPSIVNLFLVVHNPIELSPNRRWLAVASSKLGHFLQKVGPEHLFRKPDSFINFHEITFIIKQVALRESPLRHVHQFMRAVVRANVHQFMHAVSCSCQSPSVTNVKARSPCTVHLPLRRQTTCMTDR